MKEKKLIGIMLGLIYALLIIHGLALWFYLYWVYAWFDIMTHFMGGLWVGFATIWLFYYSRFKLAKDSPFFARSLITVLLSMLVVGILWEVYEVVTLLILGAEFPAGYLGDTILDVIMDMTGALTAYGIAAYFNLIGK